MLQRRQLSKQARVVGGRLRFGASFSSVLSLTPAPGTDLVASASIPDCTVGQGSAGDGRDAQVPGLQQPNERLQADLRWSLLSGRTPALPRSTAVVVDVVLVRFCPSICPPLFLSACISRPISRLCLHDTRSDFEWASVENRKGVRADRFDKLSIHNCFTTPALPSIQRFSLLLGQSFYKGNPPPSMCTRIPITKLKVRLSLELSHLPPSHLTLIPLYRPLCSSPHSRTRGPQTPVRPRLLR